MNTAQSPHVMLTICVGWSVTCALVSLCGLTWIPCPRGLASVNLMLRTAGWPTSVMPAHELLNRQRSFHVALLATRSEAPHLPQRESLFHKQFNRTVTCFNSVLGISKGNRLNWPPRPCMIFVVDLHVVALQEVGGVREEDQGHGIIVSEVAGFVFLTARPWGCFRHVAVGLDADCVTDWCHSHVGHSHLCCSCVLATI